MEEPPSLMAISLSLQWNLIRRPRTHTKSQMCGSDAVQTSVCCSRCREARTSSRLEMDVSFGAGMNSSTLRLGLTADFATSRRERERMTSSGAFESYASLKAWKKLESLGMQRPH